ncbi:hypothetical protein Tco_0543156 [Tanacetum coccineum]
MSTNSLMAEKTVHNVAYTDLRHKAKCRVLILARTNLSQHNFTTCSRLHNFTTSSQLQDFFTTSRLHFTTLLISQLSNTTWFEASKVLDYLSRTVASYTDVAEVILKDIDNDDDYREVGSMMDLVLGREAYGFHVLLFVQLMFGFAGSSKAVKDSLFIGCKLRIRLRKKVASSVTSTIASSVDEEGLRVRSPKECCEMWLKIMKNQRSKSQKSMRKVSRSVAAEQARRMLGSLKVLNSYCVAIVSESDAVFQMSIEENRKALAPLKSEEQKVATDKDLVEMCLLSSKKSEEDIFVKLVLIKTKKKDVADKKKRQRRNPHKQCGDVMLEPVINKMDFDIVLCITQSNVLITSKSSQTCLRFEGTNKLLAEIFKHLLAEILRMEKEGAIQS